MIDNFCEFVKKIHADPSIQVPNFTIGDFQNLKQHVLMCDACSELVNEVADKYKEMPTDPNLNDGRWN